MNKTALIIGGGVVAIICVVIYIFTQITPKQNTHVPPIQGVSTPKDIGYLVDGERITLANGKAEREVAPGSASKETFTIFGEPVYGDLDGDADMDAAMYLVRETGGSGSFYYIIIGVNDNGIFVGTNAMYLGDRIAPQNITIENGNAVANFAERKTGEAFTVPPSVGKSVWVHLDSANHEIGELAQNFEGEADPTRMRLSMKVWGWVRTDYPGGKKLIPQSPGKFNITFNTDDSFAVTTDCNSIAGTYSTNGNLIQFDKMLSTLMYCDGSQEGDFTAMLGDVSNYRFTEKGELLLELKDKKGISTFR